MIPWEGVESADRDPARAQLFRHDAQEPAYIRACIQTIYETCRPASLFLARGTYKHIGCLTGVLYQREAWGRTNHGHAQEAGIQDTSHRPEQVIPGRCIVARPVGRPPA